MDQFDDNSIMPFGKYKGEKMANIPAEYLLWLYENGNVYGNVKQYIKDSLETIKAEINYQSKNK
jgi:uncharacterized protein (DUF3820 family)